MPIRKTPVNIPRKGSVKAIAIVPRTITFWMGIRSDTRPTMGALKPYTDAETVKIIPMTIELAPTRASRTGRRGSIIPTEKAARATATAGTIIDRLNKGRENQPPRSVVRRLLEQKEGPGPRRPQTRYR